LPRPLHFSAERKMRQRDCIPWSLLCPDAANAAVQHNAQRGANIGRDMVGDAIGGVRTLLVDQDGAHAQLPRR
jgi:hypothetical protein